MNILKNKYLIDKIFLIKKMKDDDQAFETIDFQIKL